jgi:bifunctional non-homologous end joining protein LigD
MLWRAGRPAKRPCSIEPCIPTRAKPPVGPQWIHEIKHDGHHLIARMRQGRLRLFTRRGFDWTARYPRISKAVATLRAASAVIDGEAVCWDDAGRGRVRKAP